MNVLELATSIVPCDAPKVIPRLDDSVKSFVEIASIPPFKVILAAVTLAGTAPKFKSPEIESIPPLIVFVPVYVLVPDKTQVPAALLITEVAPEELFTIAPCISFEFVDVPFNVNVFAPTPVAVHALVKTKSPEPFAVIVAPPVVPARSITLSVVYAPPVYINVPVVVVDPSLIVPSAIVVGAPKLLFAAPDDTLFIEDTLTEPSFILTGPLNVLLPDKVNAPVPALVKPPLPEITPVVIAVAFAPSIVNKYPPLTIFPVKVSPPAPDEIIVEAAVNVIGIDKDAAVAELLYKDPVDETPVPAISIRCQVAILAAFDPLTSNAPPDSTLIILVDEPVQVPVTWYL